MLNSPVLTEQTAAMLVGLEGDVVDSQHHLRSKGWTAHQDEADWQGGGEREQVVKVVELVDRLQDSSHTGSRMLKNIGGRHSQSGPSAVNRIGSLLGK